MNESNSPETLIECVRYFSEGDNALNFLISLRWPDGVCCPTCGAKDVRYVSTRKVWECKQKHSRKQFSVKVGTIFEDSPIKLDKWLCAIWLIANAKNGISSYEIHRSLGVTQKTGWFMLHRIRLAMQTGSFVRDNGSVVEVDESFIGGRARNMHENTKEERGITGRGSIGKTAVMGLLARNPGSDSKVYAEVVPTVRRKDLKKVISKHVQPGTEIHSDALRSYDRLCEEYTHKVVDHAECYVNDGVHTNGLENFWSLLKRGLKGTYVAVEPFHLFRYLSEQVFRFNERKNEDGDGGRFLAVLGGVAGKRVTYQQLIGNDDEHGLPATA